MADGFAKCLIIVSGRDYAEIKRVARQHNISVQQLVSGVIAQMAEASRKIAKEGVQMDLHTSTITMADQSTSSLARLT